ncbi:MAG TPA: NifU family protein [Micavibrio sp.]|nr:NifU family protein [Micavibrio sp.]
MMADRIFGLHQATEVRLYPFEGHDHIAVFLKNSSDWDKQSGSGGAVTVEKAVNNYLSSKLLQNGFALLRDMSDKPESSSESAKDIAGKMNNHLQKIKPETVDQHGGKVHVVEFNTKSGLLTIGLGEACSSGCEAGSLGTKSAIATRMRSRFPEISRIGFIFE